MSMANISTNGVVESFNYNGQSGGTEMRPRKRKFVYDPSVEVYPDDPWYALNHEEVRAEISTMCDNLTAPIQKYACSNQEIQQLIERARKAKNLPDIKPFYLAVLGEQGVGKSTLINALLDRKLLKSSGSSRACTAFATVLTWKNGASDWSRESDLKIEFLDAGEIKTYIEGQVQRWVEVYHIIRKQRLSLKSEDTDSVDGKDSDADTNDLTDGEFSTPIEGSDAKDWKKVSKEKQKAARTAKEFFEIIFNTAEDETIRDLLEHELYSTDISEGDFTDRCYRKAMERFAQISAQLGVRGGVAELLNVPDELLPKKRSVAEKLWPFVKLLTIATGHALFRHGLGIYDLPGFGDTSHLRRANINSFRWKADFEMVVMRYSRASTSSKDEEYLDRSIHLKGPEKTLVVLNQSDRLISEDTVRDELEYLPQSPFRELKARYKYIDSLEETEQEEPEEIQEMLDKNLHNVTVAFIKHETNIFKESVQEKGITEVFAAAAGAYLQWKTRRRKEDPVLEPQDTGIPALRQFLFRLPAKANISNLRNHILEVLPALRTRAECIVSKYVEDKSYAEMRQNLRHSIPVLKQKLEGLQIGQTEALVKAPWDLNKQEDIYRAIEKLIIKKWIHSEIHVAGFGKMMRESGNPLTGKYKDRNLNDELLRFIKPHVERWCAKMQSPAGQLADCLDQFIQAFLTQISSFIHKSSAEPALKARAAEALEDALRRIETECATFRKELGLKLEENRLRYTTEIDFQCPIAREMQPVYVQAQMVQNGKGAYDRQRNAIITAIIPDGQLPQVKPSHPLVENLGNQLVSRQKELWKACCANFTEVSMHHLQEFSDTIDGLLVNEAYMTQEHKDARQMLRDRLPEFDKSLEVSQGRFDTTGIEPPTKRIKREKTSS